MRILLSSFLLFFSLAGFGQHTALGQPNSAGNVTSLRISQAHVDLPTVTAFLDVEIADDESVGPIQTDQLHASVGPQELTLNRVDPFSGREMGTAYIFLVDISKSLQPTQQRQIRDALRTWVSSMNQLDRAAVITFGDDISVVQSFNSKINQLHSTIDALEAVDSYTQLYAGISRAIQFGQQFSSDLPDRRVIVTITDGIQDAIGGMTAEEVEQQMRVDRVPVYAVGYVAPPRTEEKDDSLDRLGAFARMSGGHYVEVSTRTASIGQQLETLQENLERGYVAQFLCEECEANNSEHRLQVQLASGNNTLSDGLHVRMKTSSSSANQQPADQKKWWDALPWWSYTAAGFAFFLVATGAYLLYRDEESSEATEEKKDTSFEQQSDRPSSNNRTSMPTSDVHAVSGMHGSADEDSLQVQIDAIGEPSRQYKVKIVDRITIGRASTCEVCISDSEASKQNTEIIHDAGEILVRDLDSTNGTVVNGVPVSGMRQLVSGDRLLVGRTEFRVTWTEDTPAEV